MSVLFLDSHNFKAGKMGKYNFQIYQIKRFKWTFKLEVKWYTYDKNEANS